jgi:hypothetical protein
MEPIQIIIVVLLLIVAWGGGRWWERRKDPLALEGRLLDRKLRLSKQIEALQTGETPEQAAERTRQARVRAEILAIDQKNQAG